MTFVGRLLRLDQPGLQPVVDDDVVAVALEAVFVVVHHRGHGLQRLHDDPVDLVEQLAGHLLAAGALEVEPQVADRPLAPVDVVVVLPVFLNGNVGEMNEHVIQLTGAGGVLHGAKAAKPEFVHVAAQGAVRGHQDVQAQVELPAADEERVADVQRDHVGLLGRLRHERRGFAVPGPLFDLRELVDQKDTLALGSATRFHDPGAGGAFPELLHKQVVVGGQHVGDRDKVQVEVFPTFVLLRQGAPFLLQLLPVPLDVLHHQILPRQLIVVWEMVDDLVVREPIASFHTENIADGLHAHPVEIPVLALRHLHPSSLLEVVDQHRLLDVSDPFHFSRHRPYSTGNSTQYFVITFMGKES
uniref:Putative tubulin polyglutamylase TTLL1 isoform X3 n=1 Tax=Sus scrofa TaxID=9823 RepID=A0A480HXA7_PIG